jgi:periplasmic protein TonB
MAKPQLYRPPPRWQVWAALGASLAIMMSAVVIAGIHPEPPPVEDLSQIPEAVSAVLELEPAPPEATPPPEEPDIPPPPPPPEAVPEFKEEQPTPPPQPRPKTTKPPDQPIRRQTSGAAGPVSMSSAKARAIFSPRPEYPYEARRQKKTGSGVCVLTVDTPSGNVTDATMAQSTGSPILDNSTVSAFRRWRFQPNAFTKVRVPITFTLTGASF